jgi:hypothetical protein
MTAHKKVFLVLLIIVACVFAAAGSFYVLLLCVNFQSLALLIGSIFCVSVFWTSLALSMISKLPPSK